MDNTTYFSKFDLRTHTLTTARVRALLQKDPSQTQQSDYEKKKANFVERGIWTLIMIAGFFAALFMGHIYIILIITVVQIISFKEVIAIASVPTRARQLRSTKSLNWYWLASTMYFLYGESVIYYFKHVVLVDKMLLPLATHHRFISFMLYIIGTSARLGPAPGSSLAPPPSWPLYRRPCLGRSNSQSLT